MRRPHVFERSAPRPGKDSYQGPALKAVTARTIAAQLGNMLDRATAADLSTLVKLLEAVRTEAEKLAKSENILTYLKAKRTRDTNFRKRVPFERKHIQMLRSQGWPIRPIKRPRTVFGRRSALS